MNFITHGAPGVTTIVDMPLNSSPVTTTVPALVKKMESTKDKIWVDVALLGGIVPANAEDIIPLIQARHTTPASASLLTDRRTEGRRGL